MAENAATLYLETLRDHGWPIPQDHPQIQIDMSDAVEAFVYRIPLREAIPLA